MTAHLPECKSNDDMPIHLTIYDMHRYDCICDRLRACEQRVERRIDFMLAKANDYGERTGYAAGVQAARDAVAARLTRMGYDTEDTNPYLAAIDELKGEQA